MHILLHSVSVSGNTIGSSLGKVYFEGVIVVRPIAQQCDQMVGLFAQNLAIYSNANLTKVRLPTLSQILPDTK